MNTESKKMNALWLSKIESIREQVEQLSNEMSQFKEHPEMRHYSVILIARQPKFHDSQVTGQNAEITAMASVNDLKNALHIIADTLKKHVESMEDLNDD